MEQHKTTIYQGYKIHYRDEGDPSRNTLVLLHGFLQSLTVWDPLLLHLMRKMRVITIDLPGHGFSLKEDDSPCEVLSMEFMAEAVHTVLRELGVEQCVMLGHSLGGYVAWAYAEEHHYFLRGLGLIHSHALNDTEDIIKRRAEDFQRVQGNHKAYILDFIPNLFDEKRRSHYEAEISEMKDQCITTRQETILATLIGMVQRPDRTQVLANMEVPVLFIYGKNDRRLPLDVGLSQAKIPRHSEIMVLDDVAHMSFIEMKDYVRPRIENFVNTCYL